MNPTTNQHGCKISPDTFRIGDRVKVKFSYNNGDYRAKAVGTVVWVTDTAIELEYSDGNESWLEFETITSYKILERVPKGGGE